MGILSAFLGSSSTSSITAVSALVSARSINSCSASIEFTSTGSQITRRNLNNTVLGNWVIPTTSADQWEIRTILVSGETPIGDALNTWLPLTSTRSWGLSSFSIGDNFSSFLTFEFRKAGGTTAEVTVPDNFISIEVLDGFDR